MQNTNVYTAVQTYSYCSTCPPYYEVTLPSEVFIMEEGDPRHHGEVINSIIFLQKKILEETLCASSREEGLTRAIFSYRVNKETREIEVTGIEAFNHECCQKRMGVIEEGYRQRYLTGTPRIETRRPFILPPLGDRVVDFMRELSLLSQGQDQDWT